MYLAAQSRGVSFNIPKGEQLGNKLDMREPASDTNALRVFVVIAVIIDVQPSLRVCGFGIGFECRRTR